MQDNLVIVESPAKAKTIEKILGDNFLVKSSYGHIRDLAKNGISIDIEHGFTPSYEISPDKTRLVSELRKAVKEAKVVWLASDEDREGEAIAWHLYDTLGLKPDTTKRIVFHEITPTAIRNAVENPRQIDKDLVDAQQARRILDRLVGFELSPLLWRKVRPSLSAGRVQSVAVKLIVERERDIIGFTVNSYYRVVGEFRTSDGHLFKAELKDRIATQDDALIFIESLKGCQYTISSVETTPAKRSPAAPFTTSTLQQEASRKLSYSVSQTMSVAQKLYEAGLITYMRTDSTNLSGLAIGAAKDMIVHEFGERYHKTRQYTTKSKGAQEAHEAIRPTYMDQKSAGATPQERRLYELIWRRTVASQMADAALERTTVKIQISSHSEIFVATGEVIIFDGFLKLYIESTDDEKSEAEGMLPRVSPGQSIQAETITATERFTQKPPRYSEASLVKKLEELGIGRPSTYAPTISTVITRGYVVKEDRQGSKRDYHMITLKSNQVSQSVGSENSGAEKARLSPTDIGMVVTDFLEQHFPNILEYTFTASVEKEFDEIAEGKIQWQNMLTAFYTPFHKTIEQASENSEYTRTERLLGIDPVSGKNVYARVGRFGPMVQLGEAIEGSDEKPKFASLQSGQLVATIELEQALSLFALPRTLGQFEGKDVVIGIGRFGAYVRHNGTFTSLKKGIDDPYSVTLDRAVDLINEKRQAELSKHIATYGDIQVINGRYGPYISYKDFNYKIPKSTDATKLTEEECVALIAEADKNGTATKSKAASKSTTAKSSSTKTATKKSVTIRKKKS